MNRYAYDGPVVEFETCIARRWKSSTYAPSEQKARSNLAYQFKVANGKMRNARISLPGKIKLIQ